MRGLMSVVVLVFIMIVGFASHAMNKIEEKSHPIMAMTTTTTTQPRSNIEDNRRMFRENHRADDDARNYFFRVMLRTAGERCDRIRRTTMSASGTWSVHCEPSSLYVFQFNKRGEPTHLSRFQ